MSIKDQPIIFGVCVCCIIILIVVIIVVIYSSMNRNKKEGFRRLVLNRIMAGGSNTDSVQSCGRQFRGNEINYLLQKEKLPEDWYNTPKEDSSEITTSDITKEIADKTLNEITEQTGVNVKPEQQQTIVEPQQEVKPTKTYDTTDKINEDRTVETNVGKPVNGPVVENFNGLRITAFNKKPQESLIASSNGNTEPYQIDLAMRKFAKQNFK